MKKGLLLMAVVGIVLCSGLAGDALAQRMYWADLLNGSIHRANLNGSDKETISSDYEDPYGILYEFDSGMIFWTELGEFGVAGTGKIWTAAPDGSGATEFLSGLGEPMGLAYHDGHLYWVDHERNEVNRADIDTPVVENLVETGPDTRPIGLAIDVINGHIYWAEFESNKIRRSDLDGSSVADIYDVTGGTVMDLALDVLNQRIYYARFDAGGIFHVSFLGTNNTTVVTSGVVSSIGLALDLENRRVFWTDPLNATVSNRIRSADMDVANSNISNLGANLTGTHIRMIALDVETILPVELISFEARLDGRDVSLLWATASETNSSGFEVQYRRATAAGFESVAFVEASGSQREGSLYSYTVPGINPGSYVFRLRQVDLDGSFAYSPEVDVTVELATHFELFPAYPNPFNPITNFVLTVAQEQTVTIEVYNTLGMRVATLFDGVAPANEATTYRFDAASLPSGMYMVRAAGTNFVATQKVVLLK